MKVGVLGGTFDPVHYGHLKVAAAAERSLGLAEVIFIPAGQPRLKPDYPVTMAEHRLQMLRLALEGKPHFLVSTVEIERPGPSYAVDTIAGLRRQIQSDDKIFFILGWDALDRLNEWREPSKLITMCRLVGVYRPGYPRPNLEILEKNIPGISQRVVFLEQPRVDISASKIREMASKGLSLRHLVPAKVAKYIKERKLYLSPQEV